MIKKIGVLIFGAILIFSLLSVVSALGVGVSICGNGILEAGEQCDAGRSAYSFAPNYPSVFCSSMTCTCPTGSSPLIKSFEFADSCVQITDCTDSTSSCNDDKPKCDCPGEPACRCEENKKDWVDKFFECNTCNIPSGVSYPYGDGRCYCDDFSDVGGGLFIGPQSRPYCSSLGDPANYNCKWSFGGSWLNSECAPWNVTICAAGATSCTYNLLGTINTTCCASGFSCDPSIGCTNITTPAPVALKSSITTLIKIGGGDELKRNVICSATIKPSVEGVYDFTISLEGSSMGPVTFTQNVVNDTSICPLLTPSPFNVEHTFVGALNKNSSALRCRISYHTPTESNVSLSESLHDIDKDRFDSKDQWNPSTLKPWTAYDVDDWVFNSTRYGDYTSDYKCVDDVSADYDVIINETLIKRKNCSVDSNNDGIGDFAACSYCRNPSAFEDADDIDNNGWGVCQANVSRACRIEGDSYAGDGADNPGAPINVLNASGWIIAKMGCGDVKNIYGVTDTFCQMVDDVPGMKEYQRAIKWGERVYTSTKFSVLSPTLGSVEYNQTIFYEFIPGGSVIEDYSGNSKISDSACSLTEVVIPEGTTSSTSGIDAFTPLILNNPIYASGYTLEKRTTGNWLGLQYVSALVKHTYYPNCMPLNESGGKRRNTNGSIFPDQFIDSFRGELSFNNFGISPSILRDKDSYGNFKWQWQTAFVNKDKCNDGVNNQGTTNILSIEPYGRFFLGVNTVIVQDGTSNQVHNLNPEFNVSLVDVDNPDCKWINPVIIGTDKLPKKYDAITYKINSVTGRQYCRDNDYDGFCGAKLSSLIGGGTYDFNDTNYTLSKQFPDCDDGDFVSTLPGFTQYNVQGNPLLVSPIYGWDKNFSGQNFTGWNVHPFAPVNQYTCTLGTKGAYDGYDFNCNKDGVVGYDFESLKKGDTPFDWSLFTGTENLAYGADSPWYTQISIKDYRDAQCYEYPAYRDAVKETAINSLMTLGGLGFGGLATAGSFALRAVAVREVVGLTFNSPLLWNTCIKEKSYGWCVLQLGAVVTVSALQIAPGEEKILSINKQTGKTSLLKSSEITSPAPRIKTEFGDVDALNVRGTTPVKLQGEATMVPGTDRILLIKNSKRFSRIVDVDPALYARNLERSQTLLFGQTRPEYLKADYNIFQDLPTYSNRNRLYPTDAEIKAKADLLFDLSPSAINSYKVKYNYNSGSFGNDWENGLVAGDPSAWAGFLTIEYSNFLRIAYGYDRIYVEDITRFAKGLSSVDESLLDNYIQFRFSSGKVLDGAVHIEPTVGAMDFNNDGTKYAGVYFEGQESRIAFRRKFLDTVAVSHEFGHFVQYKTLTLEKAKQLNDIWLKTQRGVMEVSGYSLTNSGEFFAESYASWNGFDPATWTYVGVNRARALLKSRHPEQFEFINGLEKEGFFTKLQDSNLISGNEVQKYFWSLGKRTPEEVEATINNLRTLDASSSLPVSINPGSNKASIVLGAGIGLVGGIGGTIGVVKAIDFISSIHASNKNLSAVSVSPQPSNNPLDINDDANWSP